MLFSAIIPQDLRTTASPTFAGLTVDNLGVDGNAVTSSIGDIELAPTSGNVKIGAGAADTDYTLTFDGETNDGVLTWMEDEDYFKFNDDIMLPGGENIVLDTTTGTQIATATSQLLGFYGVTPVDQPDTISDSSTQDLTGTDTIDQTKLESDLSGIVSVVNTLIDRLQELGLIA